MALHPDFPHSPHAILDPELRWFPANEVLRDTTMEKLMPPLVAELRRKVKGFRDSDYAGASDTSRSLLNWWFKEPHLLPGVDGSMFKLTNGRVVIVETKGQQDLDVPLKMARLRQWCDDINKAQTETDFGFVFVDETKFNNHQPRTFGDLFAAFREYRTPSADRASSSV